MTLKESVRFVFRTTVIPLVCTYLAPYMLLLQYNGDICGYPPVSPRYMDILIKFVRLQASLGQDAVNTLSTKNNNGKNDFLNRVRSLTVLSQNSLFRNWDGCWSRISEHISNLSNYDAYLANHQPSYMANLSSLVNVLTELVNSCNAAALVDRYRSNINNNVDLSLPCRYLRRVSGNADPTIAHTRTSIALEEASRRIYVLEAEVDRKNAEFQDAVAIHERYSSLIGINLRTMICNNGLQRYGRSS
jgi:hypothetical protein